MFLIINRVAFHSLLAKLRPASSLAGVSLMSFPGDVPVDRAKRKASVPYFSRVSTGLSTLPLILLIFSPFSSRTRP